MNRILRILSISTALSFALYFFSIDYLIKTALESQGTRLLATRLDIGSVTFHILPMSIRLAHVQIADPRQPMRNLLELDSLAAPLVLGDFIDQKIDMAELQIHGLRFNTARSQSSATSGNRAADKTAATALPDATQLLAQQKQHVQDELRKTQVDLTAIRNKWQQRLQQLPDANRIENYRMEAQTLRSTNKSAELIQLRQTLNNELGGVRKLADEFALDRQHTQAQLTYARGLPQHGIDSLNTTGLAQQSLNNIAGAVLGGEFTPALQQLLDFIKQSSHPSDTAVSWPLLIRKITLDGQLDLGASPLLFTGAIDNLTPQPLTWNVATDLALDGSTTATNKFNLRGHADFRKTASLDMRFDLREFPLQQFPLSKNPQLSIVIDRANTDIQGLLSLTGNQIDVNILSRFQQALLNVQTSADPAVQTIAGVLRDTNAFDLKLQVTGNIQNPAIKLDSNLNQRLAAAMSQQLQAQAGATQNGLSAQLQQQLGPEFSGIQQLATDFENLQQQLLAKQNALQAVLNM